MRAGLVLFMLMLVLSPSLTYKIGFLISTTEPYSTALQNMARYATNTSTIDLITEQYEPTMRGITDACCRLVEAGVIAVIAKSTSTDTAVQADYLSPLKVPLITVTASDPFLPTPYRNYLLRMTPSDVYQSRAMFDLIQHFRWQHISILATSDTYGIHGLLGLHHLIMDKPGYTVDKVFFFEVSDGGVVSVSHELEELKNSLARVIVLNCAREYGRVVLETAHSLGLMDHGFVWLVTDAIAAQPGVLAKDGVILSFYEGLIGIRPSVNNNNRYYEFRDEYLQSSHNHTIADLSSYSLMAYDTIGVVRTALGSIKIPPTQEIRCSSREGWAGGAEVLSALKSVKYTGITGITNFTNSGESRRVLYDIVNFKDGSFHTAGTWHNVSRLKITKAIEFLGHSEEIPSGIANNLEGAHLRFGVLPESPFMFLAMDNCQGNDCWSGICPEIIRRLSDDLGFTYEYFMPKDGKWGGYNSTTHLWDGLVKDLMSGRIDMITIHLSTNSVRKEVLEYSTSIMDSSIAAVVKGESGTRNSFFFLSALSLGVWLSVLAASLIITLLIWLFSKASPFDKSWAKIHARNRCPCENCTSRREEELEETTKCEGCIDSCPKCSCLTEGISSVEEAGDISFYESIWLTGTGLVAKTSKVLPYCMPARFLLFSWWFFMLFIISVYTANLTAFLTLNNVDTPISNIQDLLHQDEYEWGIMGSSHPETLLLTHADPMYSWLVEKGQRIEDLESGLEKVRNGGFVFIDEAPVFAHHLKTDCDVSYILDGFQPFEYAFGLPKESPYTSVIDKQILMYREEGFMDKLWDKWSPANEICSSKMGHVTTLYVKQLSGMFYILAIAVAISVFLALLEVVYASVLDMRTNQNLTFFRSLRERLLLTKDNIFNDGKQMHGRNYDKCVDLKV